MLSVLPDFLDLTTPDSNLAAFAAEMPPTAAVAAPQRGPLYMAWDGTPLGYGAACDPLTAERGLSGIEENVPAVLKENRFEWGAWYALPLLAAIVAYHQGATPLKTAFWSLGAYMAPLPVAALLTYTLLQYGDQCRSMEKLAFQLAQERY